MKYMTRSCNCLVYLLNSEKCLTLNPILVNNLESLSDKLSTAGKNEKNKNKLLRKITFEIPQTFKGRPTKKMKTTKTLFRLDSFRKNIFGIKEEEAKVENNVLVTEKMAETINNSVLQFIKLEYENISLEENEVFVGETFVDVFFIAGLPYMNSKVMSDSEGRLGSCKHAECSILQSYRPDLLHRFPNIDYKGFELNSHV